MKNLEQILKPQIKLTIIVGNLNNLSSKHSKTRVFRDELYIKLI